MALEIERRFLVRGEGWQSQVDWQAELRQGYLLSREDGLTMRLRLQRQQNGAKQAWLTIKAMAESEVPSHARLEFEYAIPVEDAEALLKLAPDQINKKRYGLHLPGGDWVLDVFSGRNAPLVIAEVEVQNPEDSPPIPCWCIKEVTGMHQLSNAALAHTPFQNWPAEQRNALWQVDTIANEDRTK